MACLYAWIRYLPACLGLLGAAAASAAETSRPILHIPRVHRAPQLDDFLAGRPREAEAVVSDFRQRDPHDGAPASFPTTAYLSYDQERLYVVFVCRSDPKQLRARLSKRDQVFGDETVNIALDTFHDRRRAYMFFSNPLGVQLDGITTEGQDDDFSFDAVWQSAGKITEDGYIVWMAIPFRSLRFPRREQQTWGIALTRYLPGQKEFAAYPHITQKIEGYVEQFATLEGLEGVSPGRNIQIQPYGFLAGQQFLAGPLLRSQIEKRGGFDAKWVWRDALSLDVTVHPDFSQVESDDPQVTINQRYEVYFPERRPFFLENAGFFETPEMLFFSRRIIDPEYGARVSGKLGPWSLGFLTMDDQATLGPRAKIGVARIQRDVLRQSTVGIFTSNRQEGVRSNTVLALDTRLRLTSHWVFTGQAIHSETRDEGLDLGGNSYFSEVRYTNRRLQQFTYYRDRSPGFQADLGFIPRTDLRQLRHGTTYRWRPERGPILSYGPSLYTTASWNHAGQWQDWLLEAPFRLELRGPTTIEASHSEGSERYRQLVFRRRATSMAVSTDWLRWLGVSASVERGRDINYYPRTGLLPCPVDSTNAQFGVTWRSARRVRFTSTYLFNRLTPIGNEHGTVFNDHVARAKLNIQFTRLLSLRTIVDYHGVLPDQRLVDMQPSKRLTGDVLLTYLVHPGTALYAGWTDRRENLLPTSGARTGGPVQLTGRQVFVKVSYLFRP